MCGIAGYFGKGNYQLLEKANKILHHRGPDDEGFFIQKNIGLTQRRLAIVDLSPHGRQPMSNEQGDVWLVFNGEIYNHLALKKQLKGPHSFKSQTDSEIIIHLYEELGTDVFELLNGMFAIAIWDKRQEKLILARDRVGEKPLYYAQLRNNFYFASELKAFQAIKDFKPQINPLSFIKFIDQGYLAGESSIYQQIKKLLPAHYLIFQNNRAKIQSYWQLPKLNTSQENQVKEGFNFNKAQQKLDNLISDSVKIRLMSDVPLGIFLSGGLDSSLIAYYAQHNAQQKIKTFNIKFENSSFDESKYARQVAAYLKTNHTQETISAQELLSIIDELPDIMDEPLADSSIIPVYWLSRITKKYVSVALGGDGADEFFCGYQTFKAWHKWQLLQKQPDLLIKTLTTLINRLPSSQTYFSLDFKLKRALLNFDKNFYYQHFRWFSSFTPKELIKLINPEIFSVDYLNYQNTYPAINYKQPILQSLYLYQKYYLSDDIFTKVDRASMAVSLETRAPFVDYRLIEFANSLPLAFKFKKGETKYILKKIAEKYLPKEIIYRPKHGFPAPVDGWLRGPLKNRAEDLFSKYNLKKQNLLNPDFVQFIWRDFLRGNHYRARQVWAIFVWCLWLEKKKLV